jgi:uncharacterized protein
MRLLAAAAATACLVQCSRLPQREDSTASAAHPVSDLSAAAVGSSPPPPATTASSAAVDATTPPPASTTPPPASTTPPAASTTAEPSTVTSGASQCPPDPDPAADASLPVAQVVFPQAGEAAVSAEVASTEAEEERGLMYRTSMPENHGMLFEMGVSEVYQFWMKDTCIPLDMIFADGQGNIVGIVQNAAPLNDTPLGVGRPSSYVLEVNGGWTSQHGVAAGQHMTIPPSAP